MSWVDDIMELLPSYAKDVSENLEEVIIKSSLPYEQTVGCALAAAMTAGNGNIVSHIAAEMAEKLAREQHAALEAAAITVRDSIYFSYADKVNLKNLSTRLTSKSAANFGGTTNDKFQSFCLASAIVTKCPVCIDKYYNLLKDNEYTDVQLQDIGRIAAVMTSVCRLMIG